MTETRTNIKGLPPGKYFTEIGYSQTYPWVVVKQTPLGYVLAQVRVGPDPDWHPETIPGGFAGHCVNQQAQTWLYKGVDQMVTRRIRKNKRGDWSLRGTKYVEDMAREFYDYNF